MKRHGLEPTDAVIEVRDDGAWRVLWAPSAVSGSGWVTWAPPPKSTNEALTQLLLSRGKEPVVEALEKRVGQLQAKLARSAGTHGPTIHRLQNRIRRQRVANARDAAELARIRESLLDLAGRLDASDADVPMSPYAVADELRDLATPLTRWHGQNPPKTALPDFRPVVLTTDVEAGRAWAADRWPGINPISQVAVLTPKNIRALVGRDLNPDHFHWVERPEDPDQFTDDDRAFVASRMRMPS